MNTVWRDIAGYEGLYEVSNEGQVRRLIRLVQSAHDRGERRVAGLLKPQRNSKGRLRVNLCKEGIAKWHQVHRLVLIAFTGPPPFEGAECRHMDGNPERNCIGNLEWGTHTQNMQDKTAHGTQLIGNRQPNTKLDEHCVRAIRISGLSTRELAKLYGVSQVAIHLIKARKTWKHVED